MRQPLGPTRVLELSKIGLGALDFIQQLMTRLCPDTGFSRVSERIAGCWFLIRIGCCPAPLSRKHINSGYPLRQQSITLIKGKVGRHNEYACRQRQLAH